MAHQFPTAHQFLPPYRGEPDLPELPRHRLANYSNYHKDHELLIQARFLP